MPDTALVTGASSGIGLEIARHHAARGGDLIVTARRAGPLEALRAEFPGVAVHAVPLDLGAPGGAEALIGAVDALGLPVEVLVNNAGFGGRGVHVERDLADELAMIDLNVRALVTLTHHFGGAMAARGAGRVLQVGSTAGFAPGPQQAVYFATKAFVNSFSQAVDYELRPRGVTCTLLAPGYVETGFADRADLGGTKLTAGGGATAASVARFGYEAMMRGELVAVNDRKVRFALDWVMPFVPRRRALKMIGDMQSR